MARNGHGCDCLLSDVQCLHYNKVSDNLATGTAETDAHPMETMAIHRNRLCRATPGIGQPPQVI